MLDIILFYITEYFLYVTLMTITVVGAFYFRGKCRTYEERKYIGIFVVTVFLIMFSGIGSCVKPYFTNMSKLRIVHNSIRYSFRGTGSFVNPNVVLTNKHVVDGCKNLAVSDKNNVYVGKLISTLERKKGDLAFIITNANRKEFATVGNKYVNENEVLLIPNYTSGKGVFDVAKALVNEVGTRSSLIKNFSTDNILALSPKVRMGNSGSPVYNKKGYLVGVLHSVSCLMSSSSSRSTPINVIRKFAKDNGVSLYYSKNNVRDLSKMKSFKDNFAVNILCGL